MTLDLENRVVIDDNLISEGSITASVHTVGDIDIVSLATEIIIAWQGSKPGSNGRKGYEAKVEYETVASTSNLAYPSSSFVNGACNFVSAAAISDDNTILDYRSIIFTRDRNRFGNTC